MTRNSEDVIGEALRHGAREGLSEGATREALAALEALVGERDDLAERLRGADAEIARLRRVEEAAAGVLNVMGGRRSATPMLAAIAELRAALKG